MEDYAPTVAGDREVYPNLLERFRSAAHPLVQTGADIVVPAGVLSALLLSGERRMTLGHATVVSCVVVTLVLAEAAVRIAELTGSEPSRGPHFALASRETTAGFREFARGSRAAPGERGP